MIVPCQYPSRGGGNNPGSWFSTIQHFKGFATLDLPFNLRPVRFHFADRYRFHVQKIAYRFHPVKLIIYILRLIISCHVIFYSLYPDLGAAPYGVNAAGDRDGVE